MERAATARREPSLRAYWAPFAVGAMAVLLTTGIALERWTVRGAERSLLHYVTSAAALRAAALQSVLDKHRSLPLVLSDDADVRATLTAPSPAGVTFLNEKLERLGRDSRVSVVYILDRNGRTIASSNWKDPESFVDKIFAFRPYFQNAMQRGDAEYFALGATSHRPGLYMARRVDGPDGGLGVVVVKEEFDNLEAQWRASSDPTYVTGENGVVLLTSEPQWRFRSAGSIEYTPSDTMQFGGQTPALLPLRAVAPHRVEETASRQRRVYEAASVAVGAPGWTLHLLAPTDRVLDQAVASARITAVAVSALIMLMAGLVVHRRLRASAAAVAQERARALLETQVEARTRDLRKANDDLLREMEERRRAEAKLLAAQDGLGRTNKLATLGQIAAGVAHEINQPVAAIRAYADNSIVMLDRKRTGGARENLKTIASLTERIDLITNEMKDFSRKSQSKAAAIELRSAVEGAIFLVGWRARSLGIALTVDARGGDAIVHGDKVRIEQVLVNLLSNSIDALEGIEQPQIQIQIQAQRTKVTLSVIDNGRGVDEKIAPLIFSPFNSTKKDGLGLGLVISRDIVTELGGDLHHELQPRGAKFVMSLKRASSCSPR